MAYRMVPRKGWDKDPPRMGVYSYVKFGVLAVIHHTAGQTDDSYILEGKPGSKWYAQVRKRVAAYRVRKAVVAYEKKRRNVMQKEIAAMRSWKAYHQSRGWTDIGYHYVIFPSGHVYEGRPWNTRGAHAVNGNHMPGISFAGNFEINKPTSQALNALEIIKKDHDIKTLTGHYRIPGNSTSCPGKYLKEALHV